MKKWFNKKLLNQTGSSLIEVIVATGVIALVLTALVAGMTVSLQTSAEAKYRSQAIKRGQEAMEVFRRERTLWRFFAERELYWVGMVLLINLVVVVLTVCKRYQHQEEVLLWVNAQAMRV